MKKSRTPAAVYTCTTKDCPSEPFNLSGGASRDQKGRPWCVACYAWRRRWVRRWTADHPGEGQPPEPPNRTRAERPVPNGAEHRRCITAHVLPELADLLTARQQAKGFKRQGDLIVHELARIVRRPDLGPRKPKKA